MGGGEATNNILKEVHFCKEHHPSHKLTSISSQSFCKSTTGDDSTKRSIWTQQSATPGTALQVFTEVGFSSATVFSVFFLEGIVSAQAPGTAPPDNVQGFVIWGQRKQPERKQLLHVWTGTEWKPCSKYKSTTPSVSVKGFFTGRGKSFLMGGGEDVLHREKQKLLEVLSKWWGTAPQSWVSWWFI